MGKGTRKREATLLRQAQEARLEAERKKKQRTNRIVGIVAAVVVLAIVGGSIGAILHHKKITSNDYIIHNTVVASSSNYEVTQAMMTYFTNSTYVNYCTNYKDQLEDLGLDTTVSLKAQTCAYDSNISWYDYFTNTTQNTVTWMLSFAEQARADGLTLTQEYKDLIEETLAATTPTNFGDDLNLDDVRACLELYYMAIMQENKVQEANVPTDAEINAWADANNKTLLKADYTYYNIPYGTGAYYTTETAQEVADQLLACTTEEEFVQIAKGGLLARKVYSDAATLEKQFAANYLRNNYAYREEDGFSDWLFSADRKVGDTTLVDRKDSSSMTVYFCRRPAARDDSTATVDVRHILFTKETYKTDDATKAKAEEVLAEWKNGDATEASFGELAKKYTEDSNADKGGLYEGVTQGQMVETFNDWCFDAARKTGDTGIVKTDYGYHVMYFVKVGEVEWYNTARETLESDNYKAISEEYKTKYNVTVNAELAKQVQLGVD